MNTRSKVLAWLTLWGVIASFGVQEVSAHPMDMGMGVSEGPMLPPPPPVPLDRPLMTLKRSIELHRDHRDYEQAQILFDRLNDVREHLPIREQRLLDRYSKRNSAALRMKNQVVDGLKQARAALNAGQFDEAEKILNSVKATPGLSRDNHQLVKKLDGELQQKRGNRWLPKLPSFGGWFSSDDKGPAPPSADELLKDAKSAMASGDFDTAERFARAAKEQESILQKMWLFSTDAEKLLDDIKEGRAQQRARLKPKQIHRGHGFERDISSPNMMKARELLRRADAAAEAGDVVTARRLVAQAEDLNADVKWWEEYAPQRIRNKISKFEGQRRVEHTPAEDEGVRWAKEESVQRPLQPAEVKSLVQQARRALDEGNIDQADALAKQARMATTVDYGLFEDTPTKVLADVVEARTARNQLRAAELLQTARRHMERGEFDEAERLTWEAGRLRPTYGWWYRGDRPDTLREEITNRRRGARKQN